MVYIPQFIVFYTQKYCFMISSVLLCVQFFACHLTFTGTLFSVQVLNADCFPSVFYKIQNVGIYIFVGIYICCKF